VSAGETHISAALARLKEHGYLDDAAFAETYARLRQENEKLGVRRVRQDLQQKGVDKELTLVRPCNPLWERDSRAISALF
jgi:regulatory protein